MLGCFKKARVNLVQVRGCGTSSGAKERRSRIAPLGEEKNISKKKLRESGVIFSANKTEV